MWWIYALALPILSGFVGGLCSFLLLNWGIYRFQLGLHHRLTEAEGRIERETKIRASEASRRGRNVEQDLLEQLQNQKAEPQVQTLAQWTKSKFHGSV